MFSIDLGHNVEHSLGDHTSIFEALEEVLQGWINRGYLVNINVLCQRIGNIDTVINLHHLVFNVELVVADFAHKLFCFFYKLLIAFV